MHIPHIMKEPTATESHGLNGVRSTLHMTVAVKKQAALTEQLQDICALYGIKLERLFSLGATMATTVRAPSYHALQHVIAAGNAHGKIDDIELPSDTEEEAVMEVAAA